MSWNLSITSGPVSANTRTYTDSKTGKRKNDIETYNGINPRAHCGNAVTLLIKNETIHFNKTNLKDWLKADTRINASEVDAASTSQDFAELLKRSLGLDADADSIKPPKPGPIARFFSLLKH